MRKLWQRYDLLQNGIQKIIIVLNKCRFELRIRRITNADDSLLGINTWHNLIFSFLCKIWIGFCQKRRPWMPPSITGLISHDIYATRSLFQAFRMDFNSFSTKLKLNQKLLIHFKTTPIKLDQFSVDFYV